jgi:hypothetical protein
MEGTFPEVARFEAKTGHRSKRNLYQLSRSGYEVFRTEPFTPKIHWVYLRKERRSKSGALATTPSAKGPV